MTGETSISDSLRQDQFETLAQQLNLLATMLNDTLSTVRSLAPTQSAAREVVPGSESNGFVRSGDMWSVTFAGRACHLRDTSGLRFLAELLRHPGKEVHVTSLFAPAPKGTEGRCNEAILVSGLGDANVSLDAIATAQYRHRLKELQDELRDAESDNDLGNIRRLREELSFLTAELATAGRTQRTASHAERARVTVTKGIRTVLDRIEKAHPMLGRHLRATVHTGYFCSYTPDPRLRMDWEISTT